MVIGKKTSSLAMTQTKLDTHSLKCRNCAHPLEHVFADLGVSPLCESYLTREQLLEMEAFYPLCAYVCENCLLVQVQDFEAPDAIFSEYAYFSSFSKSWLEHARRYAEAVTKRFSLGDDSFVVEVASNDGYLLKNFVEQGIPVLGIDPAQNIAKVARQKGVPTLAEFFTEALAERLAQSGKRADLIAANNVLAHVPDINDFVAGFKALLKPEGVITFEFPHLFRLIEERQFDTIYHEHFSYLSILAVERIFAQHSLRIFDIETLSTHGGSLRIFVTHEEANAHKETPRVAAVRAEEKAAGLADVGTYLTFNDTVIEVKHALLTLLLELKAQGETVVGYGAPGKGNTLLNYCGVRDDFLSYTVDRNPYKQGKFLPGTHIPIHHPDKIAQTKPDYILILPWNLRDEIVEQLAYARAWGAKFIVPIPAATVID